MPALVLEPLESITQLSDRVVRVLGQNPGSFTLQGTNTYLVGLPGSPLVLIDTGEGKPAYLPFLASALGPEDTISDIVITHKHKDHWGGLRGVLEMLSTREPGRPSPPPRVWKWRDADADAEIERSMPEGTFERNGEGGGLHSLADGQILKTPSAELNVIHTPGHTPDSICLLLARDDSLFTADTILGQSTPVFTSLSSYLTSLRTLLALTPATLYPGHGPHLPSGSQAITQLIAHRQGREDQIVALLSSGPPDGGGVVPGGWKEKEKDGKGEHGVWTTEELVDLMYKEVGLVLKVAAARGVDLHLGKLEEEGRVRRSGVSGGGWEWIG